MLPMRNHINFRTEEAFMKNLAYSDNVYAWLLLHSYYNPDEKHNYIYKEDINFVKIATATHRSRQTISKRFNTLLDENIISEHKYNGKKCYKIPYYKDFEELDGETTFLLLCLPIKETKEELIKTYAFLLKKKRIADYEDKRAFYVSSAEILEEFGHSLGHKDSYERVRGILTILQGAGIIKFKTILPEQKGDGSWVGPQMEVYEIHQKASDEWLGVKRTQ